MACMRLLGIILRKVNGHLVVFLLAFAFLMMSSLSPFKFVAQGRQFPDSNLKIDQQIAVNMRFLIGSRPPRCDQRCKIVGIVKQSKFQLHPPSNSCSSKYMQRQELHILEEMMFQITSPSIGNVNVGTSSSTHRFRQWGVSNTNRVTFFFWLQLSVFFIFPSVILW